jgi:hypothetical protein
VYFLANAGTGSVRQAVSFRVAGKQPELWDPLTGARRALPEWSAQGGVTSVPLQFEPSGSLFVVFRDSGQRSEDSDQRTEVRGQKGEKNFPELKQVMEIEGPWQVTFDPKWGGPAKPVAFTHLSDWTDQTDLGIKYYSGTAVYRKVFNLTSDLRPPSSVFLDLGVVHNVVRVRLNKHDLGTFWCAPWRVEVTGLLKPGENLLELDVVNLWNNRLVRDAAQPAGQRLTRTNLAVPANRALLPSGLLGPVRLVTTGAIRAAPNNR